MQQRNHKQIHKKYSIEYSKQVVKKDVVYELLVGNFDKSDCGDNATRILNIKFVFSGQKFVNFVAGFQSTRFGSIKTYFRCLRDTQNKIHSHYGFWPQYCRLTVLKKWKKVTCIAVGSIGVQKRQDATLKQFFFSSKWHIYFLMQIGTPSFSYLVSVPCVLHPLTFFLQGKEKINHWLFIHIQNTLSCIIVVKY